jgi:ribonuclease PH
MVHVMSTAEIKRPHDQLRPITITRNFTETAAGSVLWQQGKTIVLCTASVVKDVPKFFNSKSVGGWLTADYVMLPASTPVRKPWPKDGHTDSRGTEIQRLIGRALRAIIDLKRIGPFTIHVDCQVLQADGGTRTASICGAYMAIRDALAKMPKEYETDTDPERTRSETEMNYNPKKALIDELAAVSVGVINGEVYLDLDYNLDVAAKVDMNIGYTGSDKYVEIQGAAENGAGFDHETLLKMLDLGRKGCKQLVEIMRKHA